MSNLTTLDTRERVGACSNRKIVRIKTFLTWGRAIVGHVRPRSFDRYREIIAQVDELISGQPAAPLYSHDLARRIGTSVRSLQLAAQAIHGMSLHGYIRLKRLRFAHCQLKSGLPGQSVKAAALDSGFRHMGEFSSLYKSVFGEVPSVTLVRAKRPTIAWSPVVSKQYPFSSNQN